MKVVLTYRVLQHWRAPVFRRLAESSEIDFIALHSRGFPGTPVVNGRDLSGFRHRELPTLRPLSWLPGSLETPIPFCPTLPLHLVRERPDVILAEGSSNLFNNLAVFAYARLTRTPVVWWTLGEIRSDQPLSGARRLFRWLGTALERRAAALLGYSSRALAYFARQGYPAERQFRAVNCVDTDRTREQIEKVAERVAPLRRELGLEDRRVLLFVGALAVSKRVEDLIAAYARLRERHPDLALLIVGEGAHRPALEAAAARLGLGARDVVFTGEVVDDVAAYFQLGDVFVLPGLGGLAISEAMVHGLPVLASEADGCEVDLVEEGRNGYLLTPGDRQGLEARLDELLSAPHRLDAMKAHSRWIIENRFNIDTYMESVVDALGYALTGRRQTPVPVWEASSPGPPSPKREQGDE
ncbi:MAG: glycosyltransferase family 4 protein [Proteobacteria bacterium]|nr:glycosyltransferase family 4 protein [Pseudomonadota bacterium]